jgi:hypothetical protein
LKGREELFFPSCFSEGGEKEGEGRGRQWRKEKEMEKRKKRKKDEKTLCSKNPGHFLCRELPILLQVAPR